jgi:hypothetical protein
MSALGERGRVMKLSKEEEAKKRLRLCTLVVEESEEEVLNKEEQAEADKELPPLRVQQRVVKIGCSMLMLVRRIDFQRRGMGRRYVPKRGAMGAPRRWRLNL